jgi:TRIAP1/MDM35 family protein
MYHFGGGLTFPSTLSTPSYLFSSCANQDMAHSLSKECTSLKHEYDSCFNAWFEGYLEPAVAASSNPDSRSAYSKHKADEFNAKCGSVWEKYKACVQVRFLHCIESLTDLRTLIHLLESSEGERA